VSRITLFASLFVCFCSFSFAGLHEARAQVVENDFVADEELQNLDQLRALFPFSSADPEGTPKPGETQDDVDRRLGPWLDLKGGGIAGGAPQGKVIKSADGKTTGQIGYLLNATQLPLKGVGFKRIGGADSTWGTGFMISLIENAAAAIGKEVPGLTVYIGDIAKQFGGYFNPPHKSHQNGLDADIIFMGATDFSTVLDSHHQVTSRFDYEKNWRFWQMIVAQRYSDHGHVDSIVSMILIAPEIKQALCVWAKANHKIDDPQEREILRRLRPTEGHDDHFHVRLRCSPYHTSCEKSYAPPPETGC
jgi:penicillin-insensitive murein endopeptidase